MTMPPGAIPIPDLANDAHLQQITDQAQAGSHVFASPDVHYLLKIIRKQNLVLRIMTESNEIASSPVDPPSTVQSIGETRAGAQVRDASAGVHLPLPEVEQHTS